MTYVYSLCYLGLGNIMMGSLNIQVSSVEFEIDHLLTIVGLCEWVRYVGSSSEKMKILLKTSMAVGIERIDSATDRIVVSKSHLMCALAMHIG